MSSIRLDSLIQEFPEEEEGLRKLDSYIADRVTRYRFTELPADRFYDIVRPANYRVLMLILNRLCEYGYFRRIVKLTSVSGTHLQDYDSINDVPIEIFDYSISDTVMVNMENVSMHFRLVKN